MKTLLILIALATLTISSEADGPIAVNRIVATVNGRPITAKKLSQRVERDVRAFLAENDNRRNDPEVVAGAREIVREKLWEAIHEALIEDYARRLKKVEREAWLKDFQAKEVEEKEKVYERLLEKANVRIRQPELRQSDSE
ncbi:SurA N-terminal domain-containing protein [Verrucomicrobiaceae bacterium E54]|nr:SurA N-terminal domain-containing protein [Verrucomicrobiaceae bacterium E54]